MFLSVLLFAAILILGLPLSKTIIKNDDFKSVSTLQYETEGLTIYRLEGLSPEIIWDYGNKIIKIDEANTHNNSFGLLTKPNTKISLEEKFKDYQIEYKTTFDLNPVNKGKRDYKDRLKTDFYILTKR